MYTHELDLLINKSVTEDNLEIYNEVTRDDIQSKYLEKGDACFNLNLLNTNDNNILYITGMSGSGKTTLGIDLAKELNCERVELDYVCSYYLSKVKKSSGRQTRIYDKLKDDCPIAAKFLLDKDRNEKYTFSSWAESIIVVKEFIAWFIPQIQNTGKIYIINGAQIPAIFDPEYFYNKPIIIKNINVAKTLYRRTIRETDFNNGLLKTIESFMKNIKMIGNINYHKANKDLKNYKRDIKRNTQFYEFYIEDF